MVVDLESVADELYRLRPEEFTAVRDQRSAEAVAAGDRELARRIKELRRPTLSAWVSNLLVRRKPDEARALTGLGEGLRQAHRDLDGGRLRELSRQQRDLVAALSQQARELAAEAGHQVSDEALREVEATLHAVLADPRAAEEWAAGRLAKPLTGPSGFPGVSAEGLAEGEGEPRPAPARSHAAEEGVADLAEVRERHRQRQQREGLAEARRKAEQADRRALDRQAEFEGLRGEAEWAEKDRHQLQRHASELGRELREAEGRLQAAEDRVRQVRDRLAEAERAWREARQKADAAATEVERLS